MNVLNSYIHKLFIAEVCSLYTNIGFYVSMSQAYTPSDPDIIVRGDKHSNELTGCFDPLSIAVVLTSPVFQILIV